MSLIETGRRIENGVTAIDYELKTAAVPPQKGVTLVYYPGGAIEEDSAVEVDIDEGGQVVHPDTGEPFIASLSDFAKGQWFLFGLSNADESIRVFAKGVPFPIASRGENGCQVTVELGDDKGELFVIYREGIIPNETLRQTSNSEGEIMEDTFEVDVAGKFRSFMLPAVIGKQSRKDTITFDWPSPSASSLFLIDGLKYEGERRMSPLHEVRCTGTTKVAIP